MYILNKVSKMIIIFNERGITEMKCLDIRLAGSDGKEYGLIDFKGKKTVVFIYPKDNTPG